MRGYSRETLLFHGEVVSIPRRKRATNGRRTKFYLRVFEVKKETAFEPVSGTVLVNLYGERDVRLNDRLILEGVLNQPFDSGRDRKFSYRQYLRRQGIDWMVNVGRGRPFVVLERNPQTGCPAVLRSVKKQARARLDRYFSPEESGLLATVILGDRTGLPEGLQKIFTRTGTAHVLAISGLHVGIFSAILLTLMRILCPRRPFAYLLTIAGLVFYVLVTGGRPSVVRASLMAGMFLCGYIVERESAVLNTLAAAAFTILAFDPYALFHIGFQLSFCSVFYIIIFLPLLRGLWQRCPLYRNTVWGAISGNIPERVAVRLAGGRRAGRVLF